MEAHVTEGATRGVARSSIMRAFAALLLPALSACSGATSVPPAQDGELEPAPPLVFESSTFDVTVSSTVYGRGLRHVDWGGAPIGVVDLWLDVYSPLDAPTGRPALVVVHGGGFEFGSRADPPIEGVCRFFAERGWVCLAIDYRLASDRGTVPAAYQAYVEAQVPAAGQDRGLAMYPAIRDVKAAVRWARANADLLEIDTDHIGAYGGSAGSIALIALAVTDDADYKDELALADDPTLQSTNPAQSSGVRAVIDQWGSGAAVVLLEGLDGVARFNPTDAPLAIIHGTDDVTVPFAEALLLVDEYRLTGAEHEFYPLVGEGHAAWDALYDGEPLTEVARRFLVEQQELMVLGG